MVTSDSFSNGETTKSCRMLHGSPAASAMAVGGRREWSRSFGRFGEICVQIVKAGRCLIVLTYGYFGLFLIARIIYY